MKLPNKIKEAIRKAGKHNQIAVANEKIVREWLENKMDNLAWEDSLIDALELGNNGSEDLIKFLENDCNGIEGSFTR